MERLKASQIFGDCANDVKAWIDMFSGHDRSLPGWQARVVSVTDKKPRSEDYATDRD